MKPKIIVAMKNEKYRNGIHDFLSGKIPEAEIICIKSTRELIPMKKDFSVYIISSLLSDGIWLKAANIIEKKDRMIVIALKKGPELSENIVKKRGVKYLFSIPLNSGELLKAVKQIIDNNSKNPDIPDIITKKVQERIEKFYNALDRWNYYELLKCGENSSFEDVKKQYMQLARQFHPDKFRKTSPDIRSKVYAVAKRLNEAYSVLFNKNRRNIYDEELRKNPLNIRFDFQKKVGREENPEDSIEDKQVRKFVRMAKEAMEAGDYKNAFMQLTLADQKLPGNKYVKRLLAEAKKRK